MSAQQVQLRPDHRQKLLKAFGLEMDDLVANRAGKLSPRQVAILRRRGYMNFVGAAIVCIGLGLILAFVAQKPLAPVQFILCGIFGGAMVALALYQFRKLQRAIELGAVERLTGPVRVWRQRKSGYRLRVEGRDLRLPITFWNITDGAPYHVYVTPQTDLLMAIEPVE
jgi:hypothetical protein